MKDYSISFIFNFSYKNIFQYYFAFVLNESNYNLYNSTLKHIYYNLDYGRNNMCYYYYYFFFVGGIN
jgi:hypothetical protein